MNGLEVESQPGTLRVRSIGEIPGDVPTDVIDSKLLTNVTEPIEGLDEIQTALNTKAALDQRLTKPNYGNWMRADEMRMPRAALLTLPSTRQLDSDSLRLEETTNPLKHPTEAQRSFLFIGDVFMKSPRPHDRVLVTFDD